MIVMGLELEDAQYVPSLLFDPYSQVVCFRRRLRDEAAGLGLHSTPLQKAKVQEKCNSLERRITAWYLVQAIYIPSAKQHRTLDASRRPPGSSKPHVCNLKLYLPSDIGNSGHVKTSLHENEWKLREAQAKDALNALQSHIQ
jgi:hypothetical protein